MKDTSKPYLINVIVYSGIFTGCTCIHSDFPGVQISSNTRRYIIISIILIILIII